MARVVRFTQQVKVVGADHHNGLYYLNVWTMLAPLAPPYVPAPIPPGLFPVPMSVHAVMVPIDWVSMEDKRNFYVVADGANIVSKGHTCNHAPHVPPGINILVPVTIGFATTAWKLAVSSVVATAGPVASTHAASIGFTTNCGDPVSLASGLYASPGSVHVTPSAGDWLDYGVDWAITAAVEFVVSAGLHFFMPQVKTLIAKQIFRGKDVISEAVQKTAFDSAGKLTRYRGPADAIVNEHAERASKNAGRYSRQLLERGLSPEEAATKASREAIARESERMGVRDKFSKQAATETSESLKGNVRKAAAKQAESGKLAPVDGSGDLIKKKAGDYKDQTMQDATRGQPLERGSKWGGS